jgi:hypothetical protein
MKPRSKIRNAIIRGTELISAAAQITDQQTQSRSTLDQEAIGLKQALRGRRGDKCAPGRTNPSTP